MGQGLGIGHYEIEFADYGHEGHFPENGSVPGSPDSQFKPATGLADHHILGIVLVAFQKVQIDRGHEITGAVKEVLLIRGEAKVGHVIHLFLKSFGKPFGKRGVRAVDKDIPDIHPGIEHVNGLLHGKFVEIVVKYALNHYYPVSFLCPPGLVQCLEFQY